MCWIIPLLVGLLSALLGYLLGKRFGGNTDIVTRLTEENSTLRANLSDCEAQKAQFIADSESLLAQHKDKSQTKTAGFSAATSSDSPLKITEADVTSHQLYLDLQDKYQRIKADFDTAAESNIADLSDNDIEQHPTYQALLSKYEATKDTNNTAQLSDDNIEKHTAFVTLKQALEQAESNNKTLQADFDKTEQQNAQAASMISDLRAENQRMSHSLKTQQTEANDEITSLKASLEHLKIDNTKLSADLKQCHLDLSQAKNTASDHKIAGFAASAVANTFDADAAKAVFGKKIKENDLTVVEGIGPKISQLFIDAGIATWRELGETSIEHCQKILDDAGDRYTVHNPGTWPRQAKLAADGEWQKLFDWQEQLDGGKE